MKFIVLLRGVNVGGKNRVEMNLLKDEFIKSGFLNVKTYINSGNIVFESQITDVDVIKEKCQESILEKFGLNIFVAVLTWDSVFEAIKNAPSWWGEDPESKHNAIFVIPPATTGEILAEVGDSKPDYEKVGFFGNVIFWSAPIKTFSKTRWSKIVGTSAYNKITIRNLNTTKKLIEI